MDKSERDRRIALIAVRRDGDWTRCNSRGNHGSDASCAPRNDVGCQNSVELERSRSKAEVAAINRYGAPDVARRWEHAGNYWNRQMSAEGGGKIIERSGRQTRSVAAVNFHSDVE